ncbi:hypothetical protein SDC9_205415 [bioreactor metagenome]|uniref:Uncharacterized protein n=1 Tax=bioreactor metagenome TaxID=1076179 RepID=A0A645J2A7_9ZZZZ
MAQKFHAGEIRHGLEHIADDIRARKRLFMGVVVKICRDEEYTLALKVFTRLITVKAVKEYFGERRGARPPYRRREDQGVGLFDLFHHLAHRVVIYAKISLAALAHVARVAGMDTLLLQVYHLNVAAGGTGAVYKLG